MWYVGNQVEKNALWWIKFKIKIKSNLLVVELVHQ